MATIPTKISPEQFIRIDNPDQPIYRFYPLWSLEEALRLRQLVLVAPRLWEDPFEDGGKLIAVEQLKDNRCDQVVINESLPPAYAQCWSASPESDTLLRAYSRVVKDPHFQRNICPREEGVRVQSTPRKLLQALSEQMRSRRGVSCFIGSVEYLGQEALLQQIAEAIGAVGPSVFEHPVDRARLLLMKRAPFAHEAEVRLIVVGHLSDSSDPLFRAPFDPNEVFDEVSFDPRLAPFERVERESVIKDLGYTGRCRESRLYRGMLLQIVLDSPPPTS
jgi:hypothetical protein